MLEELKHADYVTSHVAIEHLREAYLMLPDSEKEYWYHAVYQLVKEWRTHDFIPTEEVTSAIYMIQTPPMRKAPSRGLEHLVAPSLIMAAVGILAVVVINLLG